MACKVSWLNAVPGLIERLERTESSQITTAMLAIALGVTQRRIQQIFRQAPRVSLGGMWLFDRNYVLDYLRKRTKQDDFFYDRQRRQRIAAIASPRQPRLLVEAPDNITSMELDDLPGVNLAPGRIVIEGFTTEVQALEKLLALAMAISNDQDRFRTLIETS